MWKIFVLFSLSSLCTFIHSARSFTIFAHETSMRLQWNVISSSHGIQCTICTVQCETMQMCVKRIGIEIESPKLVSSHIAWPQQPQSCVCVCVCGVCTQCTHSMDQTMDGLLSIRVHIYRVYCCCGCWGSGAMDYACAVSSTRTHTRFGQQFI